ncbi:MAG: hypothetical protein WBA11_19470 [Rubrivirga sp.]
MTSHRPLAHHRGFDLALRPHVEGYRFEIRDATLTLHASAPSYRTPVSAVRAARLFIDDALRTFGSDARRAIAA